MRRCHPRASDRAAGAADISITMDWPRILPICSVTMRATTSLGPPAGKGTTTVMGRDG
jgi:hypothetical protein